MNAQILIEAGIDYQAGLARLMYDNELYTAVLTAFMGENAALKAEKAYRTGNMPALFAAVHEAKGSSGNLELHALYNACCALVKLIKSKEYTKQQLDSCYNVFIKEYTFAQAAISRALTE